MGVLRMGLGKITLAADPRSFYEFDEIAVADSGEMALLHSGNINHLHVDFGLCVFVFHRQQLSLLDISS
jgi:hypothetical protein